jgi:hypothetical protein
MSGGALFKAGKWIAGVALIALVATVGLAFASNSGPRPGTLRGHIAPSGHAKLQIRYQRKVHHGPPPSKAASRGHFRDYTWHFYRVPLKCKSGPAVARYTVKGGEMINERYSTHNREFGGGEFGGGRKKFRENVEGNLVNPNKAKGWVRVAGTRVPMRGGGTDRCDSGRLRWKVTR